MPSPALSAFEITPSYLAAQAAALTISYAANVTATHAMQLQIQPRNRIAIERDDGGSILGQWRIIRHKLDKAIVGGHCVAGRFATDAGGPVPLARSRTKNTLSSVRG